MTLYEQLLVLLQISVKIRQGTATETDYARGRIVLRTVRAFLDDIAARLDPTPRDPTLE